MEKKRCVIGDFYMRRPIERGKFHHAYLSWEKQICFHELTILVPCFVLSLICTPVFTETVSHTYGKIPSDTYSSKLRQKHNQLSDSSADVKDLNVGEELWREVLPLDMGYRFYRLRGLKSGTWYEVKISYPASIPSRFSVQLVQGDTSFIHGKTRRLLDTEKLILKTDGMTFDDVYVLITVVSNGVVAIPHIKERELVTFNIVCDELLLWVSHEVWRVVFLALLFIGIAFVIPRFLPHFLLGDTISTSEPSLKDT